MSMSTITRLRVFLAGKKTYVVSFLILLYAIAIKRGWLPNDVEVWGILFGTATVTIRAAIARIMKQFLDDLTAASAVPVNQQSAISNRQ
jgi:hypothetical protein